LADKREHLSKAIHESLMEAFALPEDKRFHRFIGLEKEDFLYPSDRSEHYTIIELSVFEGRSVEAKKQLINRLFSNANAYAGIEAQDLEITLFETPKCNWGIRGMPGDELALNYKVNV
jgi:hypothetical protein